MKKVILFLVFMSQLMMGYGQQNEDQFSPHLPRIVPVSPEAASLGKFGDVPINLSIGKLDFTIPLYTIKIGDFSYPIYLQYNSTGLKVEEDPSIVGLGWTLSAEGMISRQVRGRFDEDGSGWLTSGNELLQHQSSSQTDINWRKTFWNQVLNGLSDAQPDKFSVRAGKMSCSFLFKETGQSFFYPFYDYKLIFGDDYHNNNNVLSNSIHNITNFTIKDDAGVIYYFGTPELTEITDNPGMPQYNSSWKLNNISFLNKEDKIHFYYREVSHDSLYVKTTYAEAKYSTGLPPQLLSMNNRKETQTIVHQQLLERIVFPNGKIEFITRAVPAGSFSRNKYYLDKVIIYQGNAKDGPPGSGYRMIRTYKFIYSNLISNYHLLKEIQLYDADNNQQPFYHFTYYDEDMIPNKIHYANQDSWGYYNGKNNSNLMNGDRSVDLYSTRLGMLKTIYYPTGGYTQIEYELNKIKYLDPAFQYAGQCFTTPLSKHKTITASSFANFIGPPSKRDTINIVCDQTIRVEFTTMAGGLGIADASANMTANRLIECNNISGCSEGCSQSESAHQENGGEVNIEDLVNGDIDLPTFISMNSGSPSIDYHHHVSYFDVTAGTRLVFEVTADGSAAPNIGRAIASIDIDYSDECKNIEVGGLRIKKTIDMTSNQSITHNYKYEDDLGDSSGNLFFLPIFLQKVFYDFPKLDEPMFRNQGFFYKIFSTSQIPMISTQGNTVFYNHVVTYTNDSNKGKIINFYDDEGLSNRVVYPSYPIDLFTIKNGELKQQQILKKEYQNLVLEKTKFNSYETKTFLPINDNIVKGYLVDISKYSDLGNDLSITSYAYLKIKLLLTSQQEINYYSHGNLEKRTDYTYDNQRGYLKEQTTTDSDGKQIKVTNVYPYEVTNVNSLGTGNQAINSDDLSAYQNLTQKNIIAKPVQVEKEIQNNGQITKQKLRTTYKQVLNTDFTLPHKVSVLNETNGTNSSFEPRVIYHNYDPYGNPIEVSKADGTHIYYIYGYQHTKPIAKIVNFKQAQAQSLQAQIAAAITASDNDEDAASEDALRTALDNLRQALPDNTQITTYTYDPLIGVTSITDPKGDTQYYIYDSFNRLKYIKDKDGHILKEYEYHYR